MPTQQRENQKARETRFLEGLRRNYTSFPMGVEATEEPDFIVGSDGESIGIEFTELLRKTVDENVGNMRSQESERDKAVDNACQLYASRNLPPVDVQVSFEPCPMTAKRRKESG